MKLQRFDAGLASRLEPQLIAPTQGVVYENIDNSKGVLTPVKDKLSTNVKINKFAKYFVAEDKWVSSKDPTDYLEFQKVMYSTNRIDTPQKNSDGVSSNLGIVRPATASELQNLNKAVPLVDITVLNETSSGDLPSADLDYLLFNVNNGVYSAPFKFTVDASSTTSTSANGSVVDGSAEIIDSTSGSFFSGRNSIITEDDPANRSVTFKDIKGELATEVRLYRYYDGFWKLLNIFMSKTDSFSDSVYDISSNQELDTDTISKFNGTYQYVYTYYNNTDGSESAPSPVSKELKVESGNIQVSLPSVSADPQVTHKRLYRVGGLAAQFTLVVQLDATETSYLDVLSFSELDGRQLEADNYYEAPAGLKYLVESYAMLFGAVGPSLRFTPIGVPWAWPPSYEIQFSQDITGIGAVANGMLVFTRSKTYIVTGTGPTILSQQLLRGDQGCIAFESIQEVKAGMIIWASEDGLCSSSGNNVVSLTKDLIGKIKLSPISSAVNDEIYYCQNEDNTVLAWDYRFQPVLKWLNLGVNTIATANGELFGHSQGLLYNLYKGADNLTFKYKSPLFTEGSFSENKTYKKVYVRSEGDIILNILINSENVATFNLITADTHQLQVPQKNQRGYSIQFDIQGTGTVHELEYTVGPRQNE